MPRTSTPLVFAGLAVLLLFTACGGGGGGSSTTNPPVTMVSVTGSVRFTGVQFRTVPPIQLDYSNPVLQPARGVTVRAVDASTQAVLASGTTSATGSYSLSVPANTSIAIQVVALMHQGGSPSWDVRVQDGPSAAAPYYYTGAAFNSSTATQNVDLPLGIDVNGTANGPRASGPFAILDTIYLAIQTVLSVSPTINMPALYVDWGAQHVGTFFNFDNGQYIALMSDLTEDTDEFDRHTIAHEFGHFLEHNFSRSDSIGGAHALGDRLDPRVAFGEGWGYAFAAIVLNDPLVLDSYVDNGTLRAGGFYIESNPITAPPRPGNYFDALGCWCSESSVWSILWDLYDSAADASDNVALGFAPIWSALTGAEKTTPAATTIFSFIAALKTAMPSAAGAIDTLVLAQNINGPGINAFASAETNAPADAITDVPIPNLLPVYATIVKGTPVVVRSSNDAGRYNKVGNHRFLRYTALTTGTVDVTVTTSNPNPGADPDFYIFRNGIIIGGSTSPPNAQHNDVASNVPVAQGSDYVLDVYDCANGCSDDEGTPGDYDLTVAIN